MWYLEERPSWTSADHTNTKKKIPNVNQMLAHLLSPPPPIQKAEHQSLDARNAIMTQEKR